MSVHLLLLTTNNSKTDLRTQLIIKISMDSMLSEEKCLLGSGVSTGRVERKTLSGDGVCLCACGEADRGGTKAPRPTTYAWQRRSTPTNPPTTTMATQTALLLLMLLTRATTGAPVNQPFHSPEDYAMMANYVRREAPDPGSIGLLLPMSFTVSRPCLEAIVGELCGGVFYDPGPDELELWRRGNSNTFTCWGEECRLPNLTKYCDRTANITLEEFKSVQQSFGAMVEAPDFYSESIPQEEDGPLEMKNNFHTLYGKISDRFNVTRVRNIGPTCSQQFYCIVGDCCPTVPEVGCYTNRAAPLTTSTTTTTTPSPLLLDSNNIMAVLRLLPTDNLSHAKRAEVAEMLLEQAYNSLKRKRAKSTKRPRKGNRPPRRPRGRRRG